MARLRSSLWSRVMASLWSRLRPSPGSSLGQVVSDLITKAESGLVMENRNAVIDNFIIGLSVIRFLFNNQELFGFFAGSQKIDSRIYSFQRYFHDIVIARQHCCRSNLSYHFPTNIEDFNFFHR